jgi:hypothetical protein
MRAHIVTMAAGTVLAAALVTGLQAQQQDEGEIGASGEAASGSSDYRFAGDMQDLPVVNAVGAEIGDISRIIVQGDRMTHVIITIGGFVGLGGSEVVVPFDMLSFEGEQARIDTLATADQIEDLTLFDPDDFGLSE